MNPVANETVPREMTNGESEDAAGSTNMKESFGQHNRVLVVHPFFGKSGGAELVADRILEWLILRKRVHVTLMMLSSDDDTGRLAWLESFREQGLVEVQRVALPRWIQNHQGLFQFKVAFLGRRAKTLASTFDLCISTYNELDFGRRGFQYIHHPMYLSRRVMKSYHIIGTTNVLDKVPLADTLHRLLVRWYGRHSTQGFRRNVTAVNSQFMQTLIGKEYRISSSVLPPVFPRSGAGMRKAQPDRRFRFISVGRFSPDKMFMELVDLYAALYACWPEAEFMIVGREDDPSYHEAVVDRARVRGLPLVTVTDADDARLSSLLQTSTFYIGPKPFEHFGIALIDAIRAGCIPFVHDSGGQTEIVNVPELRYLSAQDLVAKVSALRSDSLRGAGILSRLQAGVASLTVEDFYCGLDVLLGPLLPQGMITHY